MLDDLVLRNKLSRTGVLVQLTLSIQKTWACDYRECEETQENVAVGQRGKATSLYGELPAQSKWVKISFSGHGKNEVLHFCCQEHCEDELNLLTQKGLKAPAPPAQLGAG